MFIYNNMDNFLKSNMEEKKLDLYKLKQVIYINFK